MFIGGAIRPLSVLEETELRRERLKELIALELVSPTLMSQIKKVITQLDQEILRLQGQVQLRIAA